MDGYLTLLTNHLNTLHAISLKENIPFRATVCRSVCHCVGGDSDDQRTSLNTYLATLLASESGGFVS